MYTDAVAAAQCQRWLLLRQTQHGVVEKTVGAKTVQGMQQAQPARTLSPACKINGPGLYTHTCGSLLWALASLHASSQAAVCGICQRDGTTGRRCLLLRLTDSAQRIEIAAGCKKASACYKA